MKGVIVQCLAEVVQGRFGKETWPACLRRAGIAPGQIILPGHDIDDATVLTLFKAVCEEGKITFEQAADAFGQHWVSIFAPRLYPHFYRGVTNARDFLLKMDTVHVITTQTVPNARPPRFEYSWTDGKTLLLRYVSERGLLDLLVGLIRAVGVHFNQPLQVEKLAANRLKIAFG